MKSTHLAIIQKERNVLQQKPLTDIVAKKKKAKNLPEYFTKDEVDTILKMADEVQARILMLTQFRAGLRVSEAIALEARDYSLEDERPTLRVRHGKGNKARIVPVHPELKLAIANALSYGAGKTGPIIPVSRFTALRWVQEAYNKAVGLGLIAAGKKIGTHTLRHSAARWWLENGIPINKVQLWMGHENMATTLIYLRILPDASGDMQRIP